MSTVREQDGSHEDALVRYTGEESESVLPPVAQSSSQALRPRYNCVPHVHNMTATCNLGCPLDLARIAWSTRNTEYNPKGLPGAIMRLVDPKSVALIFDSGKMVVMGTPTEATLKLAARRCAKIIMSIGFPVRFHDFKVVNMLATCDTQFPIRIEGIYYKHAFCSYYEPEVFPGLVYRMQHPKVTLMVFVSGKVVMVGAKAYSHLVTAFEYIYPSLVEFRKPDAAMQPHENASQDLCTLDNSAIQHILLHTHRTPSEERPLQSQD